MTTATWLEFVTVDVFTSNSFAGNPLAIVRIPPGLNVSQSQKLSIACEFNHSETTFLHEKGESSREDAWIVDIFTTTAELPFAGHPTIGTACYILQRIAQERGVRDGVIEASFKLKAGPTGLQYDVVEKMTTAALPHNVYVQFTACLFNLPAEHISHIHKRK